VSSAGSVTFWIHRLKAGDRAAVQRLWEGYFHRLVGQVRKRLRATPRGAADEEDVALSAFKSFCQRAEDGRFPQLLDRDDLWQLLVVIAGRKASNLAKHEGAAKRGGGNVRNASAPAAGDSQASPDEFSGLIGREPDPQLAAQVAEEYRRLLDQLPDDRLRSLAVGKMEGLTNEEMAAQLGCSLGTVERKLRLIRKSWEKEIEP
jgi:DNA-directed RNA polymerase specialized sigma24 family protein